MKRNSVGAVLLMAMMAVPLAFSAMGAQQAETKKEAPAASAPDTPVATDAAFQETLADYQMILREVERIEAATGTVEIPVSAAQLRERANLKLAKIQAWMKEHKVGENWTYDAGHRAFQPPIKVEAKKPAGTEAGKP